MPSVNNDLHLKAERLFGASKTLPDVGVAKERAVDRSGTNAVLTLAGLQEVYGLSTEQLKGLEAYIYIWDGIDEKELDDLLVLKEKTLEQFQAIVVGSELTSEELIILFDELWALAAKGELTNSSWDNIMSLHGQDRLKMTGSAFKAILGSQDGFGSNDVDGIVEFVVALNNLDGTMTARGATEENRLAFFQVLCEATNFNIIYLDKAGIMAKDVLQLLCTQPNYDVYSKTDVQLLEDMKNGYFGDELKGRMEPSYKSAGIKSWQDVVFEMLRDLEKATSKNLVGDTYLAQILEINGRKKTMAELINGGQEADQKQRNVLIAELVGQYSGKKTEIDFAKIDAAKPIKDKDRSNEYDGKPGALRIMRRAVEKAKAEREAKGETK